MHLGPRLALGLALCVPLSIAQRPASWVPQTLSSQYAPGNVTGLGKTQAYFDGNTLRFFSGFARRWYSTPVTSAIIANLRVFNDLAYYIDGATLIAFSSYRGAIEMLPLSATSSIINPLAQRNDSILTVVDNRTLWTFTCFEGRWRSRFLSTTTPRIVTQRHVLLVAEGTTFSAMSAFDGVWVTTTGPVSSTGAYADGSWGVIETPTTLFGFSAQRSQWSSVPALSGAATSLRREDCIVYTDVSGSLAYTGLRGTFAAYPHASGALVGADAVVAYAQTGTSIGLYSAVLGTWSTFTTATTTAFVTVRPHCATIYEGGILSAYSPFLGTVATLPVGASTYASNDGVASAVDLASTRLWLYSTLTGSWVAAPRAEVAFQPNFIWCGALVKTPTGFTAFAGRTGRCTPITASAQAIARVDSNSSVMAVEDTSTLNIFEPRREVWLTIPKVNPGPLTVMIWRTTLIAIDGSTVHGFGTFSGQIESYTLPAPPAEFTANSESLRAGVGTTLACFGGTPELVTNYQFPEFRRVFTCGSTLGSQLHGRAGDQAWALLGTLGQQTLPLPPFGDLLVDPATLILLPLGVLPADGRAAFAFAVPDAPVLRRLELGLQGFVQPASGGPYLTSLATVVLN